MKSPISGIFKLIYWPLCRAYAKYVVKDLPADAVLRALCLPQFRRVNGFWPNFSRPQRFSEKLWSRMLHERDPLLTLISDKLSVRDYVTSKVGSDYLIPLLWSGNKPEDIPFDELPTKFVIKANHGCGYIIIVKDKTQLDQKKVIAYVNKWLGENYCQDKYLGIEWGYKNIRPTIILESFIEENGKAPIDYKFWCFSGNTEFVTLHFDRFENHATRTLDRYFNPHKFVIPHDKGDIAYEKPLNYKKMVELAEALADGFEFIRVDLYNVQNNIYFSELTPYPGGGSAKLVDESHDYIFGIKWKKK